MDDLAIRSLVSRLARAHPSGGTVIERAAIVAEGADSRAVVTWIVNHGGTPEAAVPTSPRRGLHGALVHAGGGSEPRAPSRYVLPAGALDWPGARAWSNCTAFGHHRAMNRINRAFRQPILLSLDLPSCTPPISNRWRRLMSAEAVDLFGAHSPAFGGVGSTPVFPVMMEGTARPSRQNTAIFRRRERLSM